MDWEDRHEGSPRPMKGIYGNLGAILKEIGVMKSQIQSLGRDMQFLKNDIKNTGKIARGERSLSQRIDRFMEMVGSAEDVKNMVQKIPHLEAKNRAFDKDFNANQGKITMMEAKICNLEKLIKQMVDNVSTLLMKVDTDRGQASPQVVESQGPSKRTRAHSKKTDASGKKDEVKVMADNMKILDDQALDLMKATHLVLSYVLCYLFAILVLSLCCCF